jgi:hypothetical protein
MTLKVQDEDALWLGTGPSQRSRHTGTSFRLPVEKDLIGESVKSVTSRKLNCFPNPGDGKSRRFPDQPKTAPKDRELEKLLCVASMHQKNRIAPDKRSNGIFGNSDLNLRSFRNPELSGPGAGRGRG